MSFKTYIAEIKRLNNEAHVAIKAADYDNHPLGYCPEDVSDIFCYYCIPRVVIAGDAFSRLPWFVRAWEWFRHPINSWRGGMELRKCRELMKEKGLTA